jgi:DNA repair exonuclease SbcCD ATPase subunit
MRERKRRATFELLFGLSDSETAAAERLVGELHDRLQASRQREATVRTFLEQAGEAPEPTLLAEHEQLTEEATKAARELRVLRDELRAVTADEASRRERLATLAKELRTVQERVRDHHTELASHAQLLAQLDLDLQRVGRTRSARVVFGGLEFTTCPRCMQGLTSVIREGGCCLLCGQPEQASDIESLLASDDDPETGQLSFSQQWEVNDERRRIQALRSEVRELAAGDQRALDQALAEQAALEVVLHEMELDLDQRTKSYVSPRFEAITDVSSRLANAQARQHAIAQALAYWKSHREIVAEVAALERAYREALTALQQNRAVLEGHKGRIVELSETFDEIVQLFEPPWYESARIDLNTYLPIVNGASFDQLSGGEKTIINVAYQLALLTYTISSNATLLPSLLILDTPRKNLGARDQALADRIYRRVAVIADAYDARFQMIIADNDPAPVSVKTAASVELSYDLPLIPDLEHPGPEVESVSARMERDATSG